MELTPPYLNVNVNDNENENFKNEKIQLSFHRAADCRTVGRL